MVLVFRECGIKITSLYLHALLGDNLKQMYRDQQCETNCFVVPVPITERLISHARPDKSKGEIKT